MTVSASELLSTGLGASLSIQVGLSNNKGTAGCCVTQFHYIDFRLQVCSSFTTLILGYKCVAV